MIKEFITSKDVNHYLQEREYQFTDFEQATLVYQSSRPMEEKHSAMQKICDRTTDRELAGQI